MWPRNTEHDPDFWEQEEACSAKEKEALENILRAHNTTVDDAMNNLDIGAVILQEILLWGLQRQELFSLRPEYKKIDNIKARVEAHTDLQIMLRASLRNRRQYAVSYLSAYP